MIIKKIINNSDNKVIDDKPVKTSCHKAIKTNTEQVIDPCDKFKANPDSKVIELKSEDLKIKNLEDIIKDNTKSKIVVEFFYCWCPHCQKMIEILDNVAKNNVDIAFYKINIEKNLKLAQTLGINAGPTFIFYKNNKKINIESGAQSEEDFQKHLKKYLYSI